MTDTCEYCGSEIDSRKKYCDKQCYGNDISDTVTYTCEQCGENFKDVPAKDRTYCSKECTRKGRSTSKKLPCEECGTKVERQPNELKRAENVYCSKECNIESQKKSITDSCKNCGNDIEYIPSDPSEFCSKSALENLKQSKKLLHIIVISVDQNLLFTITEYVIKNITFAQQSVLLNGGVNNLVVKITHDLLMGNIETLGTVG